MKTKNELMNEYKLINKLIMNQLEILHDLDLITIEYINLLNIYYIIKDLLNKRNMIKDEMYSNYNEIIIDE